MGARLAFLQDQNAALKQAQDDIDLLLPLPDLPVLPEPPAPDLQFGSPSLARQPEADIEVDELADSDSFADDDREEPISSSPKRKRAAASRKRLSTGRKRRLVVADNSPLPATYASRRRELVEATKNFQRVKLTDKQIERIGRKNYEQPGGGFRLAWIVDLNGEPINLDMARSIRMNLVANGLLRRVNIPDQDQADLDLCRKYLELKVPEFQYCRDEEPAQYYKSIRFFRHGTQPLKEPSEKKTATSSRTYLENKKKTAVATASTSWSTPTSTSASTSSSSLSPSSPSSSFPYTSASPTASASAAASSSFASPSASAIASSSASAIGSTLFSSSPSFEAPSSAYFSHHKETTSNARARRTPRRLYNSLALDDVVAQVFGCGSDSEAEAGTKGAAPADAGSDSSLTSLEELEAKEHDSDSSEDGAAVQNAEEPNLNIELSESEESSEEAGYEDSEGSLEYSEFEESAVEESDSGSEWSEPESE